MEINEQLVLSTYNKQKSIKATARELGVSEGVVRKYLIGAGVVETAMTRRIAELRAAGMPLKDIAELLGVSSSYVSANTPYQKGSYLTANKTYNAIKIRQCRERKREEGAKK